MSSTTSPRIFPDDVSATTLLPSAAAATFSQGATCAPARNSDACFTNVLRLEMRVIVILLLLLALLWNSLGFPRLVLGPDPQRQRHRSDLNHCAVGQPHLAGDRRVLNERAVLALEILKQNRVVSADGSDPGMPARHAGRIQPDGALRIAAHDVVAVFQHEHALVPHQ